MKKQNKNKKDDEDAKKFSWFAALFYTVTPVWFIIDFGTDLNLAYLYYTEKEYWSFGLTLFCAIVSILFMNLYSFLIRLLYEENEDEEDGDLDNKEIAENSNKQKQKEISWTALLIFVFQLEVFRRYINLVITGCRSMNKQRKTSPKLTNEIGTATMMKVIECFTEAIPQLILQIYIIAHAQVERLRRFEMTNRPPDPIKNVELEILYQTVTITTSLILISWTAMSYSQNAHHFLEQLQNQMSWVGTVFYFLWHLGTLAARILVLSLFASLFPRWIWVILGLRWLIMTSWFMYQTIVVFDKAICNKILSIVIGYMAIYCFINIRDKPTPIKYFTYYTYEFVENTLLLTLWSWHTENYLWYFYPAVISITGSFLVGITFMIHFHYTIIVNEVKQPAQNNQMRWRELRHGKTEDESEHFEIDSITPVRVKKCEAVRYRNKIPHLIL